MKSRFIISILGVLFLAATSPLAIRGHHASGDSNQSMGGTMGGNNPRGSYNIGNDFYHDTYSGQMPLNRKKIASPGKAEILVPEHMDRQTSEQYMQKNLKDYGTYFRAEIIGTDGKIQRHFY